MHVTETLVRAADGIRLFVRLCHAQGNSATRTLLLLHGAFEHGERYLHFARWLTARGWNVVIPDYRGHGRSEGVRIHVNDFSEYTSDVEAVRTHFRLVPERTALFGHSTGGLVAVLYTQQHQQNISALTLSSPLLGVRVPAPWWKVLVGGAISWFAPETRFRTEITPGASTRNVALQKHCLHDPLSVRSLTAGWYFAMQRAIRRGWSIAGDVRIPLLVMQAGQDFIVDPEASARWLEKTSSADRHFVLRHDDYHELINEPQWDETAEIAFSWLDARVHAPAVAHNRTRVA